MTQPASVAEAIDMLNEMEQRAQAINDYLKPLPVRDVANRAEAIWNAYSMSGGLVQSIRLTRGWLRVARKELEK